jgi:glycosyltransferase involved in cell wall biosynthesis
MPPSSPKPLRVLYAVRRDLEEFAGGDTVQILNTARELRKLGVEVTFCTDPATDPAGFDCVHLWHLERVHESYAFMGRAKAAGLPTLLSTIYWPFRDSSAGPGLVRGTRENAKNLFRLIRSRDRVEMRMVTKVLGLGWRRCRQRLLDSVDILLPNSQAEADVLAQQTCCENRVVVVPNGIDPDACVAPLTDGPREGILSVGQFDPRKNQLQFVQATRGIGRPVTLVGAPRRMHRRYYQRCVRAAGDEVTFAGALPHAEVLQRMARSRVHVCPSLAETPGLVNLEAAMMGCTLVVPDCPPVKEYFGDMAVYFRPGDGQSLRDAVEQACSIPCSAQLRQHILDHYCWSHAALATLAAYRTALDVGRGRGRGGLGCQR